MYRLVSGVDDYMASRRGTAGTPLGRPVALAKKRRAAESKERADKVS